MGNQALPLDGGCRCGRVRFAISAPALLTMVCHCKGCQRMTGAAFSLSAAIPSAGFAVTRGETVIGGLHGATRHQFCGYCMSWLFTHPEGYDAFVNVRSTMLDEPGELAAPYVETYSSSKLPWVNTPAVHSYAEFPPFSDYERIVQEYAVRHAE